MKTQSFRMRYRVNDGLWHLQPLQDRNGVALFLREARHSGHAIKQLSSTVRSIAVGDRGLMIEIAAVG